MNAQIPKNATSQANATELPEAVVDRIFKRLNMIYGSGRMASMYVGTSAAEVRAYWAEKLAAYIDKLGIIASALDALENSVTGDTFPPTAGEFRNLCREYLKRQDPPQNALPYRGDPEKRAKFLAEIKVIAAGDNRGQDPIWWATHPRSQAQLAFIIDAARQQPATFQPCLDKLREDGVVSQDNRLLYRYAGPGKWERA